MDETVRRVLLRPVELRATQFLQYGSVIQLSPVQPDGNKSADCLSVTPSFRNLKSNETINEHSAVTLTTNRGQQPCQRNTFKLVHPKGEQNEGAVIKFNDDCILQSCCPKTHTNDRRSMVIYSSGRIMENPTMDIDNYYRFYYTKGNLHQPVALTESPIGQVSAHFHSLPPVASIYCRWKFVHPDPEYRFEFEGQPVPVSDTTVLILHSATNKYLTPEWERQRISLIGLGAERCVSVKYRPVKSTDKTGTWNVITNVKD